MICPNCDGILNVVGCQACGWKMGTPFPLYRLQPGSAFPLKVGDGLYPPQVGEPVVRVIVENDPGVLGDHHSIEVARVTKAALTESDVVIPAVAPIETLIVGDPGKDVGLEGNSGLATPIPDPVNNTIQ